MSDQNRGGKRLNSGRKKTGVKKTSVIRIDNNLFLELKKIKKSNKTWTAFLSVLLDINQ